MTDKEVMKPCAGRNCGSTNPNLHSAECFEDYEKVTGMARQEPVAWMYNSVGDTRFAKTLDTPGMHKDESVPLYTAPPRREWQGLTDEEIQGLHYQIKVKGMGVYSTEDIYRAIEAKLKEKNNG